MRIFVSYASQDRARAVELAAALRSHGHDVFVDQQLDAGDGYRGRLEEELRRADRVIVLWTKNSIRSQWVREEAEAARMAGKLLPVRFRVSPPFGFRELHSPDLALTADGATIASALGLGHATPPPPPRVLDRPAPRSPDDWHRRRGFGSRLFEWATKAR